jgi:Flp pilus assembly protein TadG
MIALYNGIVGIFCRRTERKTITTVYTPRHLPAKFFIRCWQFFVYHPRLQLSAQPIPFVILTTCQPDQTRRQWSRSCATCCSIRRVTFANNGGYMAGQKSLFLMLRRRLRQRNGQAVVEMTFGFLLFFSLFMAIVELSHLLYSKVTMQHALRTAGRYMITGKTGISGGNPIPRDQMVHDLFCSNQAAAGVQCPALGPNFQFACIGAPCQAPGGGPDQTVRVTVSLSKPVLMPFFGKFFPSGGVPFQLSTTWKNEPFSTS